MANLLFLTESSYHRPNDSRPVMGLSIWTQYVLDNFATVDEAVNELSLETFRIDDPDLPNGANRLCTSRFRMRPGIVPSLNISTAI